MNKPAMFLALALCAASPASAQMMGGRNGPMMGGAMRDADCPMMGMMAMGQENRIDQRLAALKAQIAIKPEQDTAWNAYASAAKKNAEGMQATHKSMMSGMQAKTPLERIDAHITAVEARGTLLKAMKPAMAALYEALSAEQKTKANTMLSGKGCMM
jgi:LTXXQ motif family protein